MVKIRLKRFGTQKRPYYRVVVQDSRKPRDGVCIEEIGTFMPVEAEEKQINIDMDRAKYWISVGAQPTDIVKQLMNKQSKKAANLDKKAKALIDVIRNNPYQIPPRYEKLIGDFQGAYSRIINIMHRLVYEVIETEQTVKIISMWTHYEF